MSDSSIHYEDPAILRKYCGYLTQLGRSEKTVFQYRRDLLAFFRFLLACRKKLPTNEETLASMPLSEIDADFLSTVEDSDIYDYLMYLMSVRGNKSAARARRLCTVRVFFEYLVTVEKCMEHSPAEYIRMPAVPKTLPKFLTAEESVSLLEAVENDSESSYRTRDYAILTLFLNCGMRLSELTGISLADIDPELRSLRVMGKGSKERIIYLNGACRDALAAYLSVRGQTQNCKDRDALFLSRLGRRISNQTVQHVVYKYLAAAGLEYRHLSTHKLRHTAATLMYQSGKVDVRVLKDILGHEQLNTTQIYTHVSSRQMQMAMEENPLAGVRRKKSAAEEMADAQNTAAAEKAADEKAADEKAEKS